MLELQDHFDGGKRISELVRYERRHFAGRRKSLCLQQALLKPFSSGDIGDNFEDRGNAAVFLHGNGDMFNVSLSTGSIDGLVNMTFRVAREHCHSRRALSTESISTEDRLAILSADVLESTSGDA